MNYIVRLNQEQHTYYVHRNPYGTYFILSLLAAISEHIFSFAEAKYIVHSLKNKYDGNFSIKIHE